MFILLTVWLDGLASRRASILWCKRWWHPVTEVTMQQIQALSGKWKSPQQQIIDQLPPSLQSEQAVYCKFAWFIKILLVRLHLNITEFICFLISLFQCFAIFIYKIIKNLLTVIQRLCNFSLTIEVWEKVNPSPSHYLIKQVSIAKWMAGQTSLIMDGQSIRL